MVFRRRVPLNWTQWLGGLLYPRGGWSRAISYLRHRLSRLPDTPQKIARGIGVGIFVSFTPLFGLHFLIAAILNVVMRGNLVAALLSTFFGNPLTFGFIAAISLQLGHFILGQPPFAGEVRFILATFGGVFDELYRNIGALFSVADADWSYLISFYHTVFLPYLVGGLLPGLICGVIGYFLSVPVIAAYQRRRRARLRAKIEALRKRIEQGELATAAAAAALGGRKVGDRK